MARSATKPILQLIAHAYECGHYSVGDGQRRVESATYMRLANSPPVEQIARAANGTTVMTSTKGYDFLNRLTNIASSSLSSFAGKHHPANQHTQQVFNAGSGNWSTHIYYHADGNGNITYLVSASQTKAAAYRYDPYGNTISASGGYASLNTYRFSSKELHLKSGLYYYGYRFYSPNWQRWPNPDPIGERGGLNLYRFNYNSPLNYVDPNGDHPILIAIIAGAVYGAVFTPYTANAPGPNDPTYPAITGEELLGGALFGAVAGGALGAVDSALTPRPSIRPSPCPVSRWGKSGPLESGNWIMEGEPSLWNYRMTGKWEQHPFNRYAPYESAQTFQVAPDTIHWPSGLNVYKGLPPFNQRIYIGPPVQPIGGVNAPPSSVSFPR